MSTWKPSAPDRQALNDQCYDLLLEDDPGDLTEVTSNRYWEQDERFRFTAFSSEAMKHAGVDLATYLGKTRRELPIDRVTDEQWAKHRRLLEAHLPFRDFAYRWTSGSGSGSGERYAVAETLRWRTGGAASIDYEFASLRKDGATVVDACLRLFRDKGYTLSDERGKAA